jgi:GDP/UDP-N,N'-diacetylbacillosamine 2-epimerase (hydrolysing)
MRPRLPFEDEQPGGPIRQRRSSPRRVLAVTGGRSDYDLMRPLLLALEGHPDYRLTVFASGSHASTGINPSIHLLDEFEDLRLRPVLLDFDETQARLKGMALELLALVQDLQDVRPELVLVLGDREDPLVGAVTAVYSWIPLAHVFGGDSGWSTVDDAVRHAVSKLASLHFTASQASAENLVAMGEDPRRVHWIGNPALDSLRGIVCDEERLERAYGVARDKPLILLCHHPLGTDWSEYARDLELLVGTCREFDATLLVKEPNNDPGRRGFHWLKSAHADLQTLPNLPRESWGQLLRRASVIVGNSSAGLLEAGFLGTPAVNYGARQQGREHGGNTSFVPGGRDPLRQALHRALLDEDYRARVRSLPCPFGDGRAAQRFLRILDGVEFDTLLPKPHRFKEAAP